MSRTALTVALLALGGGAYAVLEQQRSASEADAARQQVTEALARVEALERRLGALGAPAPAPEALSDPAGGPAPATDGSSAAAADAPSTGPTLTGSPRPAAPSASPAERLAALEQEMARMREAEAERARRAPTFAAPRPFWRDVDSAARDLGLDASQRSDLERIVEEAKRRLDDLHGQPNDEGVTGRSLTQALRPPFPEGQDVSVVLAENAAKRARWRASKVPGTNETYAQAEQRLRKESKDRARGLLTDEQAKTWDRGLPDMLFGGPAAATSVMMVDGGGAASIEIAAPPVLITR